MSFKMKIVTAGPNEALIISGLFHSPPTLIVGGRAIIIPAFQKIQRLQLNTMTLVLKAEMVYTNKGVPISITGIGQVKSVADVWQPFIPFPEGTQTMNIFTSKISFSINSKYQFKFCLKGMLSY